MTASSSDSSTRTTTPTAERIDSAQSRSSSEAALPPAIAAAPAPTSAGVFGIARTTATPSGSAASSVLVVHPGRDRQDASDAGTAERGARLGHVVRLDRDDRGLGRADRVEHGDAGEASTQHGAPLGDDLDDRELVGRRPAGGEQPAEQGLAHPPTADEDEPCRHGGEVRGAGEREGPRAHRPHRTSPNR